MTRAEFWAKHAAIHSRYSDFKNPQMGHELSELHHAYMLQALPNIDAFCASLTAYPHLSNAEICASGDKYFNDIALAHWYRARPLAYPYMLRFNRKAAPGWNTASDSECVSLLKTAARHIRGW